MHRVGQVVADGAVDRGGERRRRVAVHPQPLGRRQVRHVCIGAEVHKGHGRQVIAIRQERRAQRVVGSASGHGRGENVGIVLVGARDRAAVCEQRAAAVVAAVVRHGVGPARINRLRKRQQAEQRVVHGFFVKVRLERGRERALRRGSGPRAFAPNLASVAPGWIAMPLCG